jgi:hypothetical protein
MAVPRSCCTEATEQSRAAGKTRYAQPCSIPVRSLTHVFRPHICGSLKVLEGFSDHEQHSAIAQGLACKIGGPELGLPIPSMARSRDRWINAASEERGGPEKQPWDSPKRGLP